MDDIDVLIAQDKAVSGKGDDIDSLIHAAEQGTTPKTPESTPNTPKSPSYATGLTNDLLSGAGRAIGGAINYTVSPSGGGPANMVANLAKPSPSLTDLNTGFAKGAASGGISLANLATAPGRFLASGAPAFLGTMAGGGNYNQAKQAFQEQMQGSEIPQPQALQPKNEGEQTGALLGSAIPNLASVFIPGGAVGEGAMNGAGGLLNKMGSDLLKGELKITKSTARGMSPDIASAKQKALDVINKYKIDGPISQIGEKAEDLYGRKAQAADEAINKFATDNANDPKSQANIPRLFQNIRKEIDSGKLVNPGEEDRAHQVLDNIYTSGIRSNLIPAASAGKVPLDNLVDFKRSLNNRGDLFKNSVENIGADPIERMMREKLYLGAVQEIENKVPEAAALNREARDLRFVQKAADDASGRIANQNKGFGGSMYDIGAMSAGAAADFEHPEHLVPITGSALALMAGKRILSGGRGASALMKTGRAIQNTAPAIGGTLGTIGTAGAVYGNNNKSGTTLSDLAK